MSKEPCMVERLADLLGNLEQNWMTDWDRAIRLLEEMRQPSVEMIRASGVDVRFADSYVRMFDAAIDHGTRNRAIEQTASPA